MNNKRMKEIYIFSLIFNLILVTLSLIGIRGELYFISAWLLVGAYGMVLFSCKQFVLNEYTISKYGVASSAVAYDVKINDVRFIELRNNFYQEWLWFAKRLILFSLFNVPVILLNQYILGLTKH